MFCINCGKEIPDNSLFCPECGNKCGNIKEKNKVKINSDFNPLINYIFSSIKYPILTMKNSYETVSKSVHIGIIIILTLLVPVLNIFALKGFISNFSKMFWSLMVRLAGGSITDLHYRKELVEFQKSIQDSIYEFFPFEKLYIMDFFRTGLFYIIIIGLIFIVYKSVFKIEIERYKFLGVLSVTSILNFMLVFIATIIAFFSFKLVIVIKFIGVILNVSLLLLGMREVSNEENKLPYAVSISYGIGFVIINYIYFNYINFDELMLFIDSIF